MNKNIAYLAIFASGVAIGSVASWIFVKKKYEQIAQEDFLSRKETLAKKKKEALESEENVKDLNDIGTDYASSFMPTDEEIATNDELVSDYISDSPINSYGKPYVIPPSEFGDDEDYRQISLTFYADNLLAQEDYTLIEDVENTVGFESLGHFGEYEDDSVYVKNDRLKCYYEILLDDKNYCDVLRSKPYLLEEDDDD